LYAQAGTTAYKASVVSFRFFSSSITIVHLNQILHGRHAAQKPNRHVAKKGNQMNISIINKRQLMFAFTRISACKAHIYYASN